MKRSILLILLVLSSAFKAQTFQQDFESSTVVSDYISTVPDIGDFNGLTESKTNLITSINNGALQFERNEAATIYAFRNFNLTENPTLVQFKFDFELSNYQSGTQNPTFSVFVGNSFSSSSFGTNSTYASRFGIVGKNGTNEFKVTTVDNIGGAPSSSYYTGKQEITFIVNNSGSDQSYTAPNGNSEAVANGKMDLWVGNTSVINDFSLRNTAFPKADISGFKIQATSRSGTGTFSFDNIEFKDLLNNSDGGTETQSLIHPHIWVSPADRQGILDNISNHTWASSLFNQLKQNQASRFLNHASNPSAEISIIPPIPGNRTTHRTRLNIGVECAMLYYLTEDEKYAQIASDILHQYVKLLSVQNTDFQFYSGSFNHLIPPRELFTRVAMIYDFVQPFISSTGKTVYDLASNSQVPFNFDTSQKAFEVMADNVIELGGNASNHPVLELPGALYNVMCMEDDAKRAAYFSLLMNGAANSNQPGVNWMLDRFSDEDRLWPESAGYGKFTHALFIQLMNIIDDYQPDLKIVENNKDILESIFIYENFLYPNGATMAYGDIGRSFTDHAHIFRSVLKIADKKGYTDLKERASSTLKKIYAEDGGYNPVIENQRLEWNSPLQLLWGVNIDNSISADGEPKYGTVKASHAGVVMQRNYSGVDDKQNGLMYYTGGGTYVHAHASGLDMELYGAGYVIGPDFGGSASGYGSELHEQYAVSYAAHNTIIVNGTSGRGPKTNGNSTWQNIVDPIVLQASEPKPYANPIAANFSFSTQFLDDNQNNVDQQRTNSIIRTSSTSGYYVDIFRSKSNVVNNYHDYLFHGLGDVMQIKTEGNLLSLTDTPNRYQNDIGDDRKQPGWRWFSNTKTSALTSNSITARFDLQATNDYLHVNVPGGVDKEYSAALAPPTQEVSNGYDKKNTQVFVARKYGEAWNQPFITIYEPSANNVSTIKSTENIIVDDKVVGVKVISQINGHEIIDYVLSNDDDNVAVNLPELKIAFTGRFAIVRNIVKANTTEVSLYIGKGSQLTFLDNTINADAEDKAFSEYTLGYALSVDDSKFQNAIFMYPNPTQGDLNIKVPNTLQKLDIQLYSIQGKLIKSSIENVERGNLNFDVNSIPNGVYFIRLNMNKPVYKKFIKR
ncbi:T9SS type A sorting domain-containing protein [Polaribacter septentrionalilitoris]|uniref:T9SS type A sorting domain-containing protein n=1 Tax=Polaribacter septentrionalilitoris TaxID=2494657 RepID=UPI00135BC798|nr:T9SS type A sorting domain-containing protein [Polaribacter septentrionalilitoris]